MKAMILAAGFGTRLQPLTQNMPKALVPLAGRSLLEIALSRLANAGFDRIAINAHHFADQIRAWLAAHHYPGMEILLSQEEEILGTGGGIKRMLALLGDDEPILVHNVDVLSALPLQDFFQLHLDSTAVATLAVQARHTKRYLIFDDTAALCGRAGEHFQDPTLVQAPRGNHHFLAFNGIQVIEPRLFQNCEKVSFSSIDLYLAAAGRGERVAGRRMDEWYWRDLGKTADLEAAGREIKEGLITLS
jgi:NDP-sugar pyrophosphorylase family protein